MIVRTWDVVGNQTITVGQPCREGLSVSRKALTLANLQKAWMQLKLTTTGVDSVLLQGRLDSTQDWITLQTFIAAWSTSDLTLYPNLQIVIDCAAGGETESESTIVTRTGELDEITWTAVAGFGEDGDNCSITLTDPGGNDKALGVVVTDWDVVVNLATGAAGAITSTAAEVVAAVAANAEAAALFAGSATGTPATVVVAVGKTQLAAGAGTRLWIALGFCES